jgi:hypothetical protein
MKQRFTKAAVLLTAGALVLLGLLGCPNLNNGGDGRSNRDDCQWGDRGDAVHPRLSYHGFRDKAAGTFGKHRVGRGNAQGGRLADHQFQR